MSFTMMWLTVLGQAVSAPIWLTVLLPIAVALITALVTGYVNYRIQDRRLRHDLDQQEKKLRHEFDQQEKKLRHEFDQHKEKLRHEYDQQEKKLRHEFHLQEERLKTELRTEFMAEEAMKRLLSHPEWVRRSFDAIQKVVGGFDEDELRKLLVRSGAIRTSYNGPGKPKEEWWGLRERNEARL